MENKKQNSFFDTEMSRRRVLGFFGFGFLALSLPFCLKKKAFSAQPSGKILENKKILIVYFSMPETEDPFDMTREEENSTVVVNGKVLGNTQYAAQIIQEKTKGGIFRIVPKIPYPSDHRTLVNMAREEQELNARPLFEGSVNLDGYDTVFIGYPNWWADMPMILYTFLEQYGFAGKTVIPFCTHGGSGFSGTVETLQKLLPEAYVVSQGFSVHRGRMEYAPAEIASWLAELNESL